MAKKGPRQTPSFSPPPGGNVRYEVFQIFKVYRTEDDVEKARTIEAKSADEALGKAKQTFGD